MRVSQPLVYDQMLWKIAPYNRSTTITRGQAESDGMIMLPAARSGPVEESDITAADITALFRDNGKTDREVLLVKSVLQSKSHRVLPVKLLVYADTDRTDIQLGVVVDGELSHLHGLALIGLGGAKALGITVEAPAERPVLEPELEKAVRDRIAQSRLTGRWHRGCRRPGNRGSAGRRAQQHRPRPRDRPAQHGQRRGLGGYQHPSPARRRRRRRRAADHPTGSGHPGG